MRQGQAAQVLVLVLFGRACPCHCHGHLDSNACLSAKSQEDEQAASTKRMTWAPHHRPHFPPPPSLPSLAFFSSLALHNMLASLLPAAQRATGAGEDGTGEQIGHSNKKPGALAAAACADCACICICELRGALLRHVVAHVLACVGLFFFFSLSLSFRFVGLVGFSRAHTPQIASSLASIFAQ